MLPGSKKTRKMSEEFEAAMKGYGFTTKTIETFGKHGFESEDDLRLLRKNRGMIKDLKLNMAQHLKLEHWLGLDDNECAPVTPRPSQGDGLQSIRLDQVLQSVNDQQSAVPGDGRAQPAASGVTRSEGVTPADPQVYLRGGSQTLVKFHDIIDFIHMVPPLTEEQTINEENGVQFLLRTGAKKPKFHAISAEQWCLANTRIMDLMLETGELTTATLRDYMAYTVKVCQLFTIYERVTVLQYDREYRHMQAHYGFRWGTDAQHLHNVNLRHKSSTADGAATARFSRSSRGAASDDQLCRLFNSREGCHYDTCKFVHLCNVPGCRRAHTRLEHRDTGTRDTTHGVPTGVPTN